MKGKKLNIWCETNTGYTVTTVVECVGGKTRIPVLLVIYIGSYGILIINIRVLNKKHTY